MIEDESWHEEVAQSKEAFTVTPSWHKLDDEWCIRAGLNELKEGQTLLIKSADGRQTPLMISGLIKDYNQHSHYSFIVLAKQEPQLYEYPFDFKDAPDGGGDYESDPLADMGIPRVIHGCDGNVEWWKN